MNFFRALSSKLSVMNGDRHKQCNMKLKLNKIKFNKYFKLKFKEVKLCIKQINHNKLANVKQ